VILRLSGRLPVLVHMLAQSRPRSARDVDDPSGTAVGRFLKWERDPARRAAASLCALPLQFDEDVYRRTVPDESAAPYSWIRTLAFITDRNGQCRYHHVVRASMLRLQRAQSPARWRAAHEALAEIHRERREGRETESCADNHWEDAEWRSHRLNETYHRLCADPQRALPWALLETAQSCALRDGSVRSWAQMILQAGQDTDDVRLTEWGRRLTEASGEARTVDAVPVLDTLLGHPGLTTEGEASTRAVRGQAHLDAHRPEQALADFTAAITLEPQRSSFFIDRAFTHIRLDRRDEALGDMDRAVRLDPDSAWVYLCRGYARRWAGDPKGAVEDFTTVIGIDPEHDVAWAMRGKLLRLNERYEEALADLDRALAIDPRYGWAYYERSLCLRMLDRWDETIRDLRRYVEVAPDDVWGRVRLADALLSTGRYAQALEEINSALTATGGGPSRRRCMAPRCLGLGPAQSRAGQRSSGSSGTRRDSGRHDGRDFRPEGMAPVGSGPPGRSGSGIRPGSVEQPELPVEPGRPRSGPVIRASVRGSHRVPGQGVRDPVRTRRKRCRD